MVSKVMDLDEAEHIELSISCIDVVRSLLALAHYLRAELQEL